MDGLYKCTESFVFSTLSPFPHGVWLCTHSSLFELTKLPLSSLPQRCQWRPCLNAEGPAHVVNEMSISRILILQHAEKSTLKSPPQWQNDCRELCGSFTHEICGDLVVWFSGVRHFACYVIVYLQIWVCTTTYSYKCWLSFTSKHLRGLVLNSVAVYENIHFHSTSQCFLTTPTLLTPYPPTPLVYLLRYCSVMLSGNTIQIVILLSISFIVTILTVESPSFHQFNTGTIRM